MTTSDDKRFAKDVAKQLERRRTRRRLLLLLSLAAAIALAITYLTCGRGWGLGGKGKGDGAGPGPGSGGTPLVDAGPSRCAIRVTGDGLTVNGTPTTATAAVATCKATTGADVVVTGDARQGDWDELRAAFQAVGVKIYIRGEQWDGNASDAGSAP